MDDLKLTILAADTSSHEELPVAGATVKAGFPSPADDFLEQPLDLNRALIPNPAATFFVRVEGDSMRDAGIDDGDLLIVDRSVEPAVGKIAICFVDGEFTVKRLAREGAHWVLLPSNPKYRPIHIAEEEQLVIWGVVTYVIKHLP